MRAEVGYLASDALEGRLTGTKGAELAAQFIAGQLRRAGLKPLGKRDDYFEPFDFVSGVRVITNENRLAVSPGANGAPPLFAVEKDFRPLSFTANGQFDGEVVFAGYGLTAPGQGGERYNSYAGLDATNKIVLVLRYGLGYTPTAIAELLGIPTGTVNSRLARALEELRANYEVNDVDRA